MGGIDPDVSADGWGVCVDVLSGKVWDGCVDDEADCVGETTGDTGVGVDCSGAGVGVVCVGSMTTVDDHCDVDPCESVAVKTM